PLTQDSSGVWKATLAFQEGTSVEYKYTLGSWDTVEKGQDCAEIGNRQLRVVADGGSTQAVRDSVANWRNVLPCGN
ncbi:MAG: hypothetical protein M3P51_10585, partial [Chloroflexota bacterium]|nr:hypothetical protein [Chloroflexota bacterium]